MRPCSDDYCRATVVVYAQRGMSAMRRALDVHSLRLTVQNNSIVDVFGGSLMAWEGVGPGEPSADP